jgi:hypothetical protein
LNSLKPKFLHFQKILKSFYFYALLATLEVLKQYLTGQNATALGNQFMYYAEGFPKLRVAPDVMVIFSYEADPPLLIQ